jgi:hypothetical protein
MALQLLPQITNGTGFPNYFCLAVPCCACAGVGVRDVAGSILGEHLLCGHLRLVHGLSRHKHHYYQKFTLECRKAFILSNEVFHYM